MATAYSIYTSLAAIAWGEQAYSVTFSPVVITIIILLSIIAFLVLTRMNISERYWRALSISGGATYALYLIHQNVGYIAITGLLGTMPPFSAITLTVIGLIVFSILYHMVIERQLNPKIKKRLLGLINRPSRPASGIAT
ncbi:hypothetical protein HED51_05080 [Ochrobactrum grignonense]|nr:hypothetical protein [Brucella grignonensis]